MNSRTMNLTSDIANGSGWNEQGRDEGGICCRVKE